MAVSIGCSAQVLTVYEITDPIGQKLQARNMKTLEAIAGEVQAHKFPYPFYFSRHLDMELAEQVRADQRSIQFARHDGMVVLQITGNYYASYAAEKMDRNARARQTFLDVMLPLLAIAAPKFANDDSFSSFALEVSHHVRGKTLGIDSEGAENVALVLPREVALRLVRAQNVDQRQAALLDGMFYFGSQPFLLWLNDTPPPTAEQDRILQGVIARQRDPEAMPDADPRRQAVSAKLVGSPGWLKHQGGPPDLEALNTKYAGPLGAIANNLDPTAHLVAYAPPTFIDFHGSAYVQLSMTTSLEPGASGSQYKLAALAFDQHITHLVRLALKDLPDSVQIEGVDFSTTVKVASAEQTESVEFLFPQRAMRCFAAYECTGQQLINAAVVLINGERAGLDLQKAEGEPESAH